MLNPVWLRTFVTLVDTGHFTKTADKLFMTQPGVSQHINKLEQACGHSLIKRDKKSFVITEQGRLVYSYAQQLAKNETQLIEQLAFDDPFSGDCTLACSGALALLLYPRLLALQGKHPNLVIKLKAAPNHQILSEIKAGIVDQGIVTDIANRGLFDFEEIGKEELCLVVPSSFDSAANKAQSLVDTGLISHPDAEHYLSLYIAQSDEQELQQLDINDLPEVGFINQLSQILQPVAKGIGFTVLPKSAVDSFQDRQAVKILTPRKPVIETLYLVKKRNRVLPARYQTLRSRLASPWQ